MSRRPNLFSTNAANACTDCRLLTSHCWMVARLLISDAVFSSGPIVLPHNTTCDPNAANLRATAAPIPRPEPFTTATCPPRTSESLLFIVFPSTPCRREPPALSAYASYLMWVRHPATEETCLTGTAYI